MNLCDIKHNRDGYAMHKIISGCNLILTKAASIILCVVMLAMLFPEHASAASKSTEQAARKIFDAKYYAEHNPDVVLVKGDNPDKLLEHYLQYGLIEGRNASATFNAHSYRARYSDLDAAFGNDWGRYVRHYVEYGMSEGRDATPGAKAASTSASTANGQNTLLGTYTTKYKDKVPRATNVGIAAAGINGVVVQPGAEFSYTNTIPARTVENGYQMATVFVNKQKVKGLGGGICQVSSTLYAAMKTAGLPATERHPHSLPVDYLPEGWDATVSGQSVDLKFVNIYDKPLLITSSADGGILTVSLYLVN